MGDMEEVLKETGCDDAGEDDMLATDQDGYCNAVAKNAIASCMIVEDEDEREKCMEEAEQKVNEEDVGVTIDGCECYNFKKIHATILENVEQSCPSDRMPKNGEGWVPYSRIWYAYAMCYHRRRHQWCRWWSILSQRQRASVANGGRGQIPIFTTRPVRPGAQSMFGTINPSGANGFFCCQFNE